MSKQSRAGKSGTAKAKKRRNGAGPIAFFVSLFIVALGTIQLVATFHTYALNLAELNGLKREEASLIAKKQELENDIKRWNDKAYITAQARERLGFVFPGEQAVRVLHPEAVTGTETGAESSDSSSSSDKNVLPWYSELSYAFKKADEPVTDAKSGTSDNTSDGSSSSDSSSSDTSSKSSKSKSDSSGQSADSGTSGTDQSGQ
ncbi:FtsB family cell division protein [Bifidobacterium miconisargentati]|uniref:FtsB family cell division protein n=1 Tax=Bifidobacterium miconisargentati TaxID=2834437 RepID=UPI001BDC46E7|nr:septum formation initiator family protein [Bifidobacterium miconisargentati]MBW3089291.1 septum formation initiator family protein [Bifidobacterium miconisargentati]